MTNQIRPVQLNNGPDTCFKTGINCPSIYASEFPNTQPESGDSTNIAYREVKNMTNYKSKLRIFGMIMTVPMVFMANINPVLSISSSRQLERENSQSSLINSLTSETINPDRNNYFDANRVGVVAQLTAKQFVSESANFSQPSEVNALEIFLTSGYYSKDCRRRKVCDD
ncbi:MAG: hypothetical protein ACRC2J_14490 [Microcoleaceae cyanobacterium]